MRHILGNGCFADVLFHKEKGSDGNTYDMPTIVFRCVPIGAPPSGPPKPQGGGEGGKKPTKYFTCINGFYSTAVGKGVKFTDPLSLLPVWNPEFGDNFMDWSEALTTKFVGLIGSGAITGTNTITTLTGTTVVESNLEWVLGGLLNAGEKASLPAALTSALVDSMAHLSCSGAYDGQSVLNEWD